MTKQRKGNIQCTLAYISFFLSGCFIFSPLHKSQNIIISVSSAFITGFILLKLILSLPLKKQTGSIKSKPLFTVLCLFSLGLSVFVNLMLITEIIKDTAYVAARGVSLGYYFLLTLAILFVSYRLCRGKDKGIFRFSTLTCAGFIIFTAIMFFCFFTTKSAVWNFDPDIYSTAPSSLLTGVITGLFLTADSSIYIFALSRFYKTGTDKLFSLPLKRGFIISFCLIAAYNILTAAIFGTALTTSIKDPDYALIKLIPGMDITELVSAIRIVSFTIKSALYVYATSHFTALLFPAKKNTFTLSASLQYLLMPLTVGVLSVFDSTLGYGAFQHLIIPAVIVLSLIIIILGALLQKNEA